MSPTNNQKLWLLGVALLLTAVAYLPMLNNQFTYYSDDVYVLNNDLIHQLSPIHLKYIFLSYFDGHYHPLSLLSLGINYALHGSQAWGYQVMNGLLHLLNTALVWYLAEHLVSSKVAQDLAGGGSGTPTTHSTAWWQSVGFWAALLFGLHTLHVESVARITERKDVLFACFFLGSAIAYLRYAVGRGRAWYAASVGLLLLALLSKGQAVAMVWVVPLLDWWVGKPWRQSLSVRIVPFVVLAVVFGYLNVRAQQTTGYLVSTQQWEWYEPLVHACYVLVSYVQKLFIPFNLSVHYAYPYRLGSPMPAYLWWYVAIVALGIGLVVRYRHHISRWWWWGMGFYAANVVLMIRLLPVADNMMPDRYNYVPSVGYCVAMAATFVHLSQQQHRFRLRRYLPYIGAAYALLLAVLTYHRCGVFYNIKTVWQDGLAHNPHDSEMHHNLGNAYTHTQQPAQAIAHLRQAVQLDSSNLLARISLYHQLQTDPTQQAAAQQLLEQGLAMPPTNTQAYNQRAVIRQLLGQPNEQILDELNKAIQGEPYKLANYLNRGNVYLSLNQVNLALADYQYALQHGTPFVAAVWQQQAQAYARSNQLLDALSTVEQLIRFAPNNGNAYQLRAWLYQAVGQKNQAQIDLMKAQELGAVIDSSLQKSLFTH